MADNNLAQLTDMQIMKLFEANGHTALSGREKQILTEMEKRGFVYDMRRGEFIKTREPNKPMGTYTPIG